MKKTYNLLDEAWIPCTNVQNQSKLVSLQDVIRDAHTIPQISADLPILNGALQLLLIAFASSVYSLRDFDDWEQLYALKHFPEAPLKNYIEKWHDRFFLFDDEHPFYQDPKIGFRPKDLEKLKANGKLAEKKLTDQMLHFAAGSNATLFDHTLDSKQVFFTPETAAQILILVQAYSLGGMSAASIGNDKYFKDSPFSRGILFLCRGENIFETLLRNLVPDELDYLYHGGGGRPCWEKEDPFDTNESSPTGVRDLLTWQSRRLLLIPETHEGELAVKACFSAPGLNTSENFANPYYLNEHESTEGKLTVKPMRFLKNKVIWRDSGAILDSTRPQADKPLSITLFEKLRAEDLLPDRNIHLSLFGMCTKPANKQAYTYQEEEFNAPAVYLVNPALLQKLKEALNLAEAIRKCLYFATFELASYKIYPDQDLSESFKPDKDNVGGLYRHIEHEGYFWSQLEEPFYVLMRQLPKDDSATEAWKNTVVKIAQESLSQAAELAGTDYAGLKARAKAENRLDFEIYRYFNPEKKEK